MLAELIDSLCNGIDVDGYTIYVHKRSRGRFREEENIELHCRTDGDDAYLIYAKIFHGRPPDYYPWAELFGIDKSLHVGGRELSYLNSRLEDRILDVFGESLDAGGRLFVEYYSDVETMLLLERSFPIALTRLGYKMFRRGFTWFKDWYFPEGFMEGGWKLQAEKPLNAKARHSHLKAILAEFADSRERIMHSDLPNDYVNRALARLEQIEGFSKDCMRV